ncbi:histidine utilization repressor [Sinirhodobacter populi]|uniref:Histidine utilization repressor n=1 Tax=Paenirhodobacter populi TaxID=2306993 RepID=A0A443K8K3_9RHOB|nr:histidine utilization repressor [Sinirhodobacter populi]RWR29070.1 histidine utilization repressor [Sinirhodobacter populi]
MSESETKGSLHEAIRSGIEDKILSGAWPPGYRIPSELELGRQYGCSRMTVSKAVTELARAGLILRKRKIGSVVLPQRSQNAILEIHDVRDEVLAQGKSYRYDLLERSERAVTTAERKGAGLGARHRVVALRCMHLADEIPFCLEERIINPVVVPEARTEEFARISPSPWLIEHVPWSEAEHRISAGNADAAHAADLRIAKGAACLIIERRTWKLGMLVTHVRFTYPASGFVLQARFKPRATQE